MFKYDKKIHIPVLGLIIFSVLYVYGQFNMPDELVSEVQLIFTPCPLEQQHCRVSLTKDFTLEFSLLPLGLPVLERLNLKLSSLRSSIGEIKDLKVWFEGRGMEMGQHYFKQIESSANRSDTTLIGMIPVCVVDSAMVWRLNAEFMFRGERMRMYFDLNSEKHGF